MYVCSYDSELKLSAYSVGTELRESVAISGEQGPVLPYATNNITINHDQRKTKSHFHHNRLSNLIKL